MKHYKEIKEEIQKNILCNSEYLYISVCKGLEYALKSLDKANQLGLNDQSLLENVKKVGEYVDSETVQSICEIIRKRNKIAHEAIINTTLNRKDCIKICYDYNRFVEELNKVFRSFSLAYKIDTSIFDINLITAKAESKTLSPEMDLLKMRMRKIEDILSSSKGDTIEKGYLQYQLNRYRKELLPYEVVQSLFKKETASSCQREFFYSCGIGEGDFGFRIKGIRPMAVCKSKYAALFALIHGILQKGRIYRPSVWLRSRLTKSINLKYILRYQMLLLSLYKNNVIGEKCSIHIEDGTEQEFELAFSDIREYMVMLCRLQKRNAPDLAYRFDGQGISLSVKNKIGKVFTEDLETPEQGGYLWIERPVVYSVEESDEKILNILAENLFGYKHLKRGQITALQAILNATENAMCLMPTGYGKSLIFYFAAFLSSNFTAVVFPTRALIRDQCRNLQLLHGITDVEIISENQNYRDWECTRKMVFMDASAFLNKSFLNKLVKYGGENELSHIILDEIHSVSMLGHDFRPDYIMMSEYLKKYFPDMQLTGFTATVNHGVLNDIKRMFHISDKRIIQVKDLRRGDIFIRTEISESLEQIYQNVKKYVDIGRETSNRSLIFAKNKETGNAVYEALGTRNQAFADICFDAEQDSYRDFVEQKTEFLITSHELGIGINFPNVNSCVHVGYPVSINQFIQEVGRIAREDNLSGKAVSFVQDMENLSDDERELLDLNLPIDEILEIVKPEQKGIKDIVDLFKSIFDYLESPSKTIQGFKDLINTINSLPKGQDDIYYYPVKDVQTEKMIQLYLVFAVKTGYISEWYKEGNVNGIQKYKLVKNQERPLAFLKEKAVTFMEDLGADMEDIKKIKNAEEEEDFRIRFVLWYYDKFLNNQREELINVVNAVQEEDLEEFFALDFENVEKVRLELNGLYLEEIICGKIFQTDTDIKRKAAAVLRLAETEQNVKYDLFLLWARSKASRGDFESRVRRTFSGLGSEYLYNNFKLFSNLYMQCRPENKIILLTELCKRIGAEKILREFFEGIDISEDILYYKLYVNVLNSALEG